MLKWGAGLKAKYGYEISLPPTFSQTEYNAEFRKSQQQLNLRDELNKTVQQMMQQQQSNRDKDKINTEFVFQMMQQMMQQQINPKDLIVPSCVISSDVRLTDDFHLECHQCDGKSTRPRRSLKPSEPFFKTTQKATSQQIDLKKRADNVKEVFEVIANSKIGRAVLTEFLPQYRSGHIQIEPLTPEVRQREPFPPDKIGAIFSYDGHSSVIYIEINQQENEKTELGVLAPRLLHEIVHSLDGMVIGGFAREIELGQLLNTRSREIMRQVAVRTGKPEEELRNSDFNQAESDELNKLRTDAERFKNIRRFKGERLAYNVQSQFIRELMELFPCYKNYAFTHEGKGNLIYEPSDDAIINQYELNPDYINE